MVLLFPSLNVSDNIKGVAGAASLVLTNQHSQDAVVSSSINNTNASYDYRK